MGAKIEEKLKKKAPSLLEVRKSRSKDLKEEIEKVRKEFEAEKTRVN